MKYNWKIPYDILKTIAIGIGMVYGFFWVTDWFFYFLSNYKIDSTDSALIIISTYSLLFILMTGFQNE